MLRGDLITYVRFAAEQLRAVPADFEKRMLAAGGRELQAIVPQLQTIARCTSLTYFAALNLHQEQARSRVEQRCGKESAEARSIADAFRHAASASLEYRVAYKMRNAMLHQSMDLVGLIGRAELIERNGCEESVARVRLPLNRKKFCANAHVSRTIRDEVAALDQDPDVVEMATASLAVAEAVQLEVSDLLYPNMLDDLQVIRELDALFPAADARAGRAIAEPMRSVGPGRWTWPHHEIPPAVFDIARAAPG